MSSPFNSDEFKHLINNDIKNKFVKNDFPDVDDDSNSKVKMVSTHEVYDVEFEEIKDKSEDIKVIRDAPDIPKDLTSVNPDIRLANSAKDSYSQLFEELNHKYGFSIRFDGDNFRDSFIQIINGRDKKAMDLFLSESYSRFKSITMLQYLQAISVLSAQVLNPAFLQSESLSYQDRFDILDRLYSFVEKVTTIAEAVEIKDSEMKLEKLVEERESSLDRQSEEVTNFLELLSKNIQDKSNEENK